MDAILTYIYILFNEAILGETQIDKNYLLKRIFID